MDRSERILNSFLIDALKMVVQIKQIVKKLSHPEDKAPRVQTVRELFQLIHTLKGTATMIPKAEAIVSSLHEIEGRLTVQSLAESARNLSWLGLARESIENAHQALLDLKSASETGTWKKTASVEKESAKPAETVTEFQRKSKPGLLVELSVQSDETKSFWFPLVSVIRVLAPDEVRGCRFYCLDGTWVPVLNPQNSESAYGVGIRTPGGQAILMVEGLGRMMEREDAIRQGAFAGLDLFVSLLEETDSDSSAIQKAA
jgi:chemotaxis protein histidine kinase CheA